MLDINIKIELINEVQRSQNECCGFIYSKNGELRLEKKVNILDSPNQFLMEPPNEKPIAFYHSHLNSDEFSEEDMIVAENIGLPSILINKTTNNISIYKPHGNRIPYEGRPFILGYSDCLTLVRDYYKYQFNINLAHEKEVGIKIGLTENELKFCLKARHFEDFKKVFNSLFSGDNKDWLLRYFELNGFIKIEEIKPRDVLLISDDDNNASHCILLIQNNKILNHPYNRRSRIEKFTEYYQKKVIYKLRHHLFV